MPKYKKYGRPAVIELDTIHPDWKQFVLKADAIYPPGWSQGVTPWEILALPYKYGMIRTLELELKALQSTIETNEAIRNDAEKRAEWYRKQLVLESRLGLALSRIMDY